MKNNKLLIVFLGQFYDEKQEEELLATNKNGVSGAGNTVQKDLIKGFESHADMIDFEVITTVPAAMYPYNSNQILFSSKITQYTPRIASTNVGFINLPIFKSITRSIGFRRRILSIVKNSDAPNIALFAYSMYVPIMRVMLRIKKRYKHITTCIMISDLPNDLGIDSGRKGILRLFEKFDGRRQIALSKSFDSFVFMAEKMGEVLNSSDKPSCVVEAISDSTRASDIVKCVDYHSPAIVMYAGLIKREYNIGLLIDAIRSIDTIDVELWLFGTGDMNDEINMISTIDSRIKFFGYVDKKTVLNKQSEATIMINPRSDNGEFSKYSFPSKTMEALLSEKPLVCYKLPGIPDEYDQFLYYIPEVSAESIRATILSVLSTNCAERASKSHHARQFVLTEKNEHIQAQRIIELLNSSKAIK